MALHLVAQLDNRAFLRLEDTAEGIARARLVATAYGIEDRVQLVPVSGNPMMARARLEIDDVEHSDTRGSFASVVHQLSNGGRASTHRGDDGVLGGARVVLLTNRPAHYRIPLFDGLSERLRAAGASFRVYFLDGDLIDRPWLVGDDSAAFEHEYLRSVALPIRRHRRPSAPTRLGSVLERSQPTIVLVGGLSPLVAGRVVRIARRMHAAVGVWSGEIARAPSARGRFRRSVRRSLVADVDFGIVYGWESARYLRMLAPALPMVVGRNTSPLPEPVAVTPMSRPTFVSVGDLASDRKGMDVLVDALRLRPSLDCELRLVGGGRLLPALAARARNDARVKILGPLRPPDTRAEMSRSDIYLFPTRFDLFGLSLVEAMGCGLTSVVTPYSGAVEDLCVPDMNCIVVESHDPHEWAEVIDRLTWDATTRASLGAAAAATVDARWTLAHAVDAMIAGLRLGVMATR